MDDYLLKLQLLLLLNRQLKQSEKKIFVSKYLTNVKKLLSLPVEVVELVLVVDVVVLVVVVVVFVVVVFVVVVFVVVVVLVVVVVVLFDVVVPIIYMYTVRIELYLWTITC